MAAILWTEEFNPADITGYARTAISSYAAAAPLASVFPDGEVLDQFAEWTVDAIFNDVAQLRAYGTETPIGGSTAGEEKSAKLYPLGLKLRFGEYEQLRRMAQLAIAAQAGLGVLLRQIFQNRRGLGQGPAVILAQRRHGAGRIDGQQLL